jgi:hypothetical protein
LGTLTTTRTLATTTTRTLATTTTRPLAARAESALSALPALRPLATAWPLICILKTLAAAGLWALAALRRWPLPGSLLAGPLPGTLLAGPRCWSRLGLDPRVRVLIVRGGITLFQRHTHGAPLS